ncbi:MAG: transglycosylase domain-containing protein [Clostridia bacterium]|nr:transglycosylase domain-containing protein [Clostridia bacterium]
MKRKGIIIFSSVLVSLAVLTLGAFAGLRIYAERSIDFSADATLFEGARSRGNTVYLAYSGDELCEVFRDEYDGSRRWCPLGEVGEYLREGFIAMEDRDFYSHGGVNIRRTAGAALNYIFGSRDGFGASTITQQVIKNTSGESERTARRKINEMLRAVNLEKNYTKDEILEVYLNIVPMSGNIYGVYMASEVYFGKEPSELTAAEAATVVGITNSPGRYDPYKHPEACLEKRNRVLFAMTESGVIDRETYEASCLEPLDVAERVQGERVSSWFVETAREAVISDLMKKYGTSYVGASAMLRGASVILTVDTEVQDCLERAFEDVSSLAPALSGGLNYSMAVIDNESGNLVGIVGSAGKKSANRLYNLATAPITPGSTLKPLAIYAPLIDSGRISWSSIIDDTPVEITERDGVISTYPNNSPRVYDGLTTVAEAIKRSKNTAAVKLYGILGGERIANILESNYGFSIVRSERSADGRVLTDLSAAPLALGQLTHGVSVLELTRAYSAFPRDGAISDAFSYHGVLGHDGSVLLESRSEPRRIMSRQTARLMNKLLEGVTEDGTARSIRLKEYVDVAGKTGTSGGDKDKTFVGYTPYYTAGIWCGYPESREAVGQVSPSHLALWDRVMTDIHRIRLEGEADEEIRTFSTEGLELLPYCADSGKIFTEVCEMDLRDSRLRYGYFTAENRPTEECDCHIVTEYDVLRGCVADGDSLPESIIRAALIRVDRWGMENIEITDSPYVLPPKEDDE